MCCRPSSLFPRRDGRAPWRSGVGKQAGALFAASSEFEALWHQRYEVRGVENQIKHFNHPQLGRFSLQQMYWYSAPRNGSRLLVYLPMDEAGEQALAWLDQHS